MELPLDRLEEIQGWRSRDTMAHRFGEHTEVVEWM